MDTLNVTLKIKHGSGKPEALSPYELAYDKTANILYIGDPDGVPIVVVDKLKLEDALADKISTDNFVEFKKLLYNNLQELQQDIDTTSSDLKNMQDELEKASSSAGYKYLQEQIRKVKLSMFLDL